jgi:hypothetical protein
MHYTFSLANKRMFASAQKILGGPPEELLLSRLADGVFGDDWGFVDASFLRKAGADELGMLPHIFDTGSATDEPAPAAGVLHSLRSTLLGKGDPGLDLRLKAGLHRLGRASADLDAASLRRITRDLPPSWARCAEAAWFRLSRLEKCRASAATLRELFGNGDEK